MISGPRSPPARCERTSDSMPSGYPGGEQSGSSLRSACATNESGCCGARSSRTRAAERASPRFESPRDHVHVLRRRTSSPLDSTVRAPSTVRLEPRDDTIEAAPIAETCLDPELRSVVDAGDVDPEEIEDPVESDRLLRGCRNAWSSRRRAARAALRQHDPGARLEPRQRAHPDPRDPAVPVPLLDLDVASDVLETPGFELHDDRTFAHGRRRARGQHEEQEERARARTPARGS